VFVCVCVCVCVCACVRLCVCACVCVSAWIALAFVHTQYVCRVVVCTSLAERIILFPSSIPLCQDLYLPYSPVVASLVLRILSRCDKPCTYHTLPLCQVLYIQYSPVVSSRALTILSRCVRSCTYNTLPLCQAVHLPYSPVVASLVLVILSRCVKRSLTILSRCCFRSCTLKLAISSSVEILSQCRQHQRRLHPRLLPPRRPRTTTIRPLLPRLPCPSIDRRGLPTTVAATTNGCKCSTRTRQHHSVAHVGCSILCRGYNRNIAT
jgi:hypothetical protein